MKEAVRWVLFWLSIPFGGEFAANSGTLTFRFLNWLYEGEAETEFNAQMPKRETETIYHPDNGTYITVPKKEWIDCRRCGYAHHPYQPCIATETSICKSCGERGHFECFYD